MSSQQIQHEMSNVGLVVENLILDGNIHRCRTDSNPKSKNGWYVGECFASGHTYCTYGNWETGEKHKWTANKTTTINIPDIVEYKKKRLRGYEQAAFSSQEYIKKISILKCQNSYLIKKNINSCGVVYGDSDKLIIPMQNINNGITGLQTITTEKKRYWPGMHVTGSFFFIPGIGDLTCLCEGYATGCSINEAIGYPVIVAFDAGNMLAVANILRDKNILVCADNDHGKKINKGITIAKEIKDLTGFDFVFPPDTIQGTDFNDLANEKNNDAVAEIIENRCSPGIYISEAVNIEDDLLNPPCPILKDIIKYYNDTALKPQPLFGIAAGLLVGSVLFGRRYHTGKFGNYTAIYIVVASMSGGGKDHVKTIVRKILESYDLEQLERGGGFTAANTVIKSLEKQPLQISFFEEFGQKIREASTGKINAKGVFRQLLDIWSSCHSESKGEEYADGSIPAVSKPSLTLCGLTTPETFYTSINEELIEQGFINRLVPFISNLPRMATPLIPNNVDVPANIQKWISNNWVPTPPGGELKKAIENIQMPNLETDSVEIDFDEEGITFLNDIEKEIIEKSIKLDKMNLGDLLSRNREITIRIALIITAMNSEKTIALKTIQWSWSLIGFLYSIYVKKIKQNVSGSDFERAKLEALKSLRKAGKKGIRPTSMPKMSPWSKWESRMRNDILNELKDASLADTIKLKTGKRGPGAMVWIALK